CPVRSDQVDTTAIRPDPQISKAVFLYKIYFIGRQGRNRCLIKMLQQSHLLMPLIYAAVSANPHSFSIGGTFYIQNGTKLFVKNIFLMMLQNICFRVVAHHSLWRTYPYRFVLPSE